MAVSHKANRYVQVTFLRYEGWRSSFRGVVPTVIGMFPYAGISFLTYETLKAQLLMKGHGTPEGALGTVETLVCGGTAGVVSQTATYPVDTVRKFMQANTLLHRFQEGGHVGGRLTMWKSVRHIYSAGGLRAFYNGVSLNWAKGFLAAGLSFAMNEWLRQLLQQRTRCRQRLRGRVEEREKKRVF
eukprot:GHVS01040096.1.p1 GENE.GHVS01040096.1~~GHVS01040096.1.p1  ORF type:complete len:185 (+),score=19.02 GHVS01040096.1:427-981(+)